MNQELKGQNKKYLLEKLTLEERRLDGRALFEKRKIIVEENIIQSCLDSIIVQAGKTKLIIALTFEFSEPYSNSPRMGSMTTNLDLSFFVPITDFSKKKDIQEKELELTRVIDRGIRHSNIVNFQELCVIPEQKCLNILFDVTCLSDDGGIIDLSIYAINKLILRINSEKIKKYIDLISFLPDEKEFLLNNYDKIFNKEIIFGSNTVAKVDSFLMLDPTSSEEADADCLLSVSTTNDMICSMQKFGVGGISEKEILTILNKILENK